MLLDKLGHRLGEMFLDLVSVVRWENELWPMDELAPEPDEPDDEPENR